MENETQITTTSEANESFQLMQRRATALSKADILPKSFQGDLPKCMIVLEMSDRIGANPMMVAQSIDIIHGRPSWRSSFIIAAINKCGRFNALKFRMTGEKGSENFGCIAWSTEKDSGEIVESPEITIEMAKAEGWLGKSGSKWKTMPELMLRYRAAAFFGRLYAPEILMGMHTIEENQDTFSRNTEVISADEVLKVAEPEPVETEIEESEQGKDTYLFD